MALYRHNADCCYQERLGGQGVSQQQIAAVLKRLEPALEALKARRDTWAAALMDLPARQDDLGALETLAGEIRKQFTQVVVAGLGGSGLSGRMLSEFKPGYPIHFLENIDPDAITYVLAKIDPANTCFIIISKSGGTVETLGQFYVLLQHAKTALGPKEAGSHFIVITGKNDSPLRRSASEHGMKILDHEDNIGGRFSVLTNVGLLPGAVIGVDIRALRQGARSVVEQIDKAKEPSQCLAALGAALQFSFLEKGHNITVMLPYGERLAGFSSWYRQCWSESLGKKGQGSTPIRGMGATDQHSQLQLYLDGPRDKLFHLITVKRAGSGQALTLPKHPELDYLQGKTTGDIMAAEQKATFETLVRRGCPVRLFELERLSEQELGALIMHFTLEIIFLAHLLGVNPFDQPAVEDGKRLAREYLLTGSL